MHSLPPENQHCPFRFFQEFRNPNRLTANQFFSRRSGVVAASKPDHFGRRPKCRCQLIKVGIGRYNRKAIGLRIRPYNRVRRLKQSFRREMRGVGEQIYDAPDEATRKILIQQQLHNATRRPTREA